MSNTEIEPQSRIPNQVDQFMADITAYHAALSEETGEHNPDVIVSELFTWTDPALHPALRIAIWSHTDADWSVVPTVTDSGEAQLVLRREEDKFHYF